MNLNKGLVGHWTMDDRDTSGGTLYDSSAYDNHATLNNTITQSQTSPIGQGQEFDDTTNAYMDAAYSFGSSGNIPVTMSCWFWADQDSTWYDNNEIWAAMMDLDERESTNGSFMLNSYDDSTGNTGIHVWGNSLNSGRAIEDVGLNEWHHYVGVNDPVSGEQRFYIDGVLEGTSTFTLDLIQSGTIDIGRRQYSSQFYSGGKLSDCRLYNRVLSESDIRTLYNMRSPRTQTDTLSKGLVGHWTLDAGATSNGTAYDSSANDNHGTLNGGITTGVSGQINEAYSFDGSDDYILASANSATTFNSNSFTLTAWVKTTGSDWHNVISQGQDTFGGNVDIRWLLSVRDSNIHLEIDDNSTLTSLSGSTTINDDTWHFIVGIRDGSSNELRVYVDGVLDDNTSDNTGSLSSADGEKSIGAAIFDNNYFAGEIDDVRIYNRALSANEVKRLYNKRT